LWEVLVVKTVEQVRAEIPFLQTDIIYLDNAATTPTPQPVLDAMLEYFREYSANVGRGLHRVTRRATEEFEAARGKLARVIGAKPGEIAYTKNATEAINAVTQGLGLQKGDKVMTTVLEHHSNLIPWQRLEKQRGVKLEVVRATPNCLVDPAAIEAAIDKNTKLIAMTHVSNAIGSIQPIKQVGKLAAAHDLLFLIDASQAVGHMPVDVKVIGCDFLAAPGHKGLLGPQGTGFLYAREDRIKKLEPLLSGGGIVESVDEHSFKLVAPPQIFDAGTPNIPGVIGLGRAAEYVLEIGLERIAERERKLTQQMLKIAELNQIEVYGPSDIGRRGGVVSFNLKGMDHHDFAATLDEIAKIAVRSGHHCAQPTMRYLGIEGTVRASVHYYNLEEEIEKFIEVVGQVAREFGDEA
jgi:cysteine desulfurase/selenocysteine lyase